MTPQMWHRVSPQIASQSSKLAIAGLVMFVIGLAITVVGRTHDLIPGKLGAVAAALVTMTFILAGLGFAGEVFKKPPPSMEQEPLRAASLFYGAIVVDVFLAVCIVIFALSVAASVS